MLGGGRCAVMLLCVLLEGCWLVLRWIGEGRYVLTMCVLQTVCWPELAISFEILKYQKVNLLDIHSSTIDSTLPIC